MDKRIIGFLLDDLEDEYIFATYAGNGRMDKHHIPKISILGKSILTMGKHYTLRELPGPQYIVEGAT